MKLRLQLNSSALLIFILLMYPGRGCFVYTIRAQPRLLSTSCDVHLEPLLLNSGFCSRSESTNFVYCDMNIAELSFQDPFPRRFAIGRGADGDGSFVVSGLLF